MNLIEAVTANNIDEVKKLLSQDVDPDMYLDEAKVRPLHYAAQDNNVEIAKLLIAAGANVHAITEPEEETPLDVARLHQSREFINLLINYVEPSGEMN